MNFFECFPMTETKKNKNENDVTPTNSSNMAANALKLFENIFFYCVLSNFRMLTRLDPLI